MEYSTANDSNLFRRTKDQTHRGKRVFLALRTVCLSDIEDSVMLLNDLVVP